MCVRERERGGKIENENEKRREREGKVENNNEKRREREREWKLDCHVPL